MESPWFNRIKQLHALATSGLQFTQSHYERDRYEEIQKLAAAMLADIGQLPIETVNSVLVDGTHGYQTPKIDVRAAVIRDNQILLVQEKTDKRWALPGGYADIGLSAAENAIKEVWEEAGIHVAAKKLYGVRHKAKGEYPPDARDFYKMFFLCTEENQCPVKAGSEVIDARFFALDQLPELSLGRVVVSDIQAAFNDMNNPSRPTYFDQAENIDEYVWP